MTVTGAYGQSRRIESVFGYKGIMESLRHVLVTVGAHA